MKLIVEDHCIRCGICIDVCPALFELDKKNDVMLVKFEEVSENLMKGAQEAIESCAVQAIKMEK